MILRNGRRSTPGFRPRFLRNFFFAVIALSQFSLAAVRFATPFDFVPIGTIEVVAHARYDETGPGRECDTASAFEEERISSDPEEWWSIIPPENRVISTIVPIYAGDERTVYAGPRFESFPGLIARLKNLGRSDCSAHNIQSEIIHEKTLKNYWSLSPVTEFPALQTPPHSQKPFICDYSKNKLNFTVIGDSNAFVFEVAQSRVSNSVNIVWRIGATLRGLNNMSSSTGAGRIFRHELKQKEGLGEVLIVYLGDNDAHGYKWQDYREDYNDGIRRSIESLNQFLIENFDNRGFAKLILFGLPPQTVRRQQSHLFLKPFEMSTFEERVQSSMRLNDALKLMCASRADCAFIDLHMYVWSCDNFVGVQRPYLNILEADNHLRSDRVFGVILESLRSAAGATWCIEDTHAENECSSVEEGHPIGFEPVVLRVNAFLDAAPESITFVSPRHLRPFFIAEQIVWANSSRLILKKSSRLIAHLQRDIGAYEQFQLEVERLLGSGWGRFPSCGLLSPRA
jgi:hypothetical protein